MDSRNAGGVDDRIYHSSDDPLFFKKYRFDLRIPGFHYLYVFPRYFPFRSDIDIVRWRQLFIRAKIKVGSRMIFFPWL
jgi:hypothetical protein